MTRASGEKERHSAKARRGKVKRQGLRKGKGRNRGPEHKSVREVRGKLGRALLPL